MKALIAFVLLVFALPAFPQANPSTANGYRGIPWGTPCPEASERLEKLGIKFDRFGWQPQKEPWYPGPVSELEGECLNYSEHLQAIRGKDTLSLYELREGEIDILNAFGAICRDSEFVGVRLRTTEFAGSAGEHRIQEFKASAGAPLRQITKSAWGSQWTFQELAPKKGASRYLTIERRFNDGKWASGDTNWTMHVVWSKEAGDILKAYRRCVKATKEAEQKERAKAKKAVKDALD